MEPQPREITPLLTKWKKGDPDAFERLAPLAYPKLREIAASYVRRERNPGVVQAISLVHDLYLRLLDVNVGEPIKQGSGQAFGAGPG